MKAVKMVNKYRKGLAKWADGYCTKCHKLAKVTELENEQDSYELGSTCCSAEIIYPYETKALCLAGIVLTDYSQLEINFEK